MRCWQVFARIPVPGQVKTRLVPLLGPEPACRLYEALLHHVLGLVTQVRAGGDRCELWLDRADTDGVMQPWAERYDLILRPQPSGELGQRMRHVLAAGLERQQSVILLGSDLAGLQAAHLNATVASLQGGAELVIGPALDGGYGLLGVQRRLPPIFAESMPWSHPNLMARTRCCLRAAGREWQELAPLWDVDIPADLERLEGVPGLEHWAAAGAKA